MDVRKIGTINRDSNTIYVTLPQNWGCENEYVKIDIVNEKELKITKVE